MLKYWLWLTNLRGLHNQTRLALLRHFGSPENLFYADEDEILLTEGITREQAALLRDHDLERANRILGDCQRLGIELLTIQDAAYPARLQNIYDPPVLLYVRGHLPVMDEEAAIAVVGTRKCSPYGVACGEKLAFGLAAAGAVVVSGLAEGIDAAAVRGALRAGGTPVSVAGNGLDVKYPRENRYLYEDVAGLSLAALVIEAPARSGALITAETALEQGRDVFAVPGPIDALTSVGCNRLIRDGAGLVCPMLGISCGNIRIASRTRSIRRARVSSRKHWATRPARPGRQSRCCRLCPCGRRSWS